MRFLIFVPNLSTSIAIPIPKQETHTIHMCAIKIIWQNPPICGSIKSAQVAHIHTYIYVSECALVCLTSGAEIYIEAGGDGAEVVDAVGAVTAAGTVTFGWFDLALVVLVYLNCTSQQGIISFCFLVLPFTATASFASSNYSEHV